MKYFCRPGFLKSLTLHTFWFGLEMSHYIVSVKILDGTLLLIFYCLVYQKLFTLAL